ncbi:unnamed protein product [Caenorhabditis auriculariae]|uniref:C-type lectin domain-containing protein n=1 Tax=Caenorhabditis auriculariae TaxID=2777116 RepID=A0A8S1HRX2_9PELO|nr:unnamed protein product [Caenorhabditis auriculariae]
MKGLRRASKEEKEFLIGLDLDFCPESIKKFQDTPVTDNRTRCSVRYQNPLEWLPQGLVWTFQGSCQHHFRRCSEVFPKMIIIFYLFLLGMASAQSPSDRPPDLSAEMFCKANKGKFTPNPKDFDKCVGASFWVQSSTDKEAEEICDYLVPFEVTDAVPGYPTECDFVVYSTCPPSWYQAIGSCFRNVPGRYTFDEARQKCSDIDPHSSIVLIGSTRLHTLLIKLFHTIDRAWVDVVAPYGAVVSRRHYRDTKHQWKDPQLTIGSAMADEQKEGSIVLRDGKKSLASVICSRSMIASPGYNRHWKEIFDYFKFSPPTANPLTLPMSFASYNHYHVEADVRPYTKTDFMSEKCQKIASAFMLTGAGFASAYPSFAIAEPNPYASYVLTPLSFSHENQCQKQAVPLTTDSGCQSFNGISLDSCFIARNRNETLHGVNGATFTAYSGCGDQTAVVATSKKFTTVSRHVRAPISCVAVPPMEKHGKGCPNGFTLHKRGTETICHIFVNTPKSWSRAREHCAETYLGTLSAFASEAEKDLLYHIAKSLIGNGQAWLGAQRNGNCQSNTYSSDSRNVCYRPYLYIWTDNAAPDQTIIDKYWSRINPDWAGQRENCLTLTFGTDIWLDPGDDNSLNDMVCDYQLPFFCQILYPSY